MKKLNSNYRARRVQASEDNVIYGKIPYDSESQDIGFIEILRPGCFSRALAEADDIKSLWSHDWGKVLASTKAGTLRITDTADGLRVAITPDTKTTWGIDALSAVKRGDVTGLSFGFIVKEEGIKWQADNVREIHEVHELYEVSPVALPAFKGSCVRSRRYTCEAGRSRHTQNMVREFQDFFGIQNIPKRTSQSRKSLQEFFGRSDLNRHTRYKLANCRNFFEKHQHKKIMELKMWWRRHAYLR